MFVLFSIAVSNMPASELKRQAGRAANPFLEVTALSQRWDLFAPNPRTATLGLEAHLLYADGSRAVWTPPTGDEVIGQYRAYRWRKWMTIVVSASQSELWPATARWIADQNKRDGKRPVEVELVRLVQRPGEYGGDHSRPPVTRTPFYIARFPVES